MDTSDKSVEQRHSGVSRSEAAAGGERGDNHSANINIGAIGFGLKVIAAEYETPDAPEKVKAFYDDKMKMFGTVLTCSGHSGADVHINKHGDDKKLTCSETNGDRLGTQDRHRRRRAPGFDRAEWIGNAVWDGVHPDARKERRQADDVEAVASGQWLVASKHRNWCCCGTPFASFEALDSRVVILRRASARREDLRFSAPRTRAHRSAAGRQQILRLRARKKRERSAQDDNSENQSGRFGPRGTRSFVSSYPAFRFAPCWAVMTRACGALVVLDAGCHDTQRWRSCLSKLKSPGSRRGFSNY